MLHLVVGWLGCELLLGHRRPLVCEALGLIA
jgi:hypothetical protein